MCLLAPISRGGTNRPRNGHAGPGAPPQPILQGTEIQAANRLGWDTELRFLSEMGQELRFRSGLSVSVVQDLTEQFYDRFKPLISTAMPIRASVERLVALRTEDVVLPPDA